MSKKTTNTTAVAKTGTTVTKTTSTTVQQAIAQSYRLKGEIGWTLKGKDTYSASKLAVEIMGYRRQYRSKGIANFCAEWLRPTLKDIIDHLQGNGYTVATQIVGSQEDGYLNFCFDVSKDDKLGDTLFVAHYDTVDRDINTVSGYGGRVWNSLTGKWEQTAQAYTATSEQRLTKHVSVKNGIAYLDKTHADNVGVGCLGADDGAGLAVMLNLMYRGVLGGYCFTTGEECGGIGAGEVLKDAEAYLKQYKRSIEVDYRRCEEIIYVQSVGECASEKFTKWLCGELKMGHKPSDGGSYTDVATFAQVIPENVNIASGYINAHTADEKVDLVYIDKLAEALAVVDWTTAPEERKANEFGVQYFYDDWGRSYYNGNYGTTKRKKPVYKYNQYLTPLTEGDKRVLMTIMGLDQGFRDYVFSEPIETQEEMNIVLDNWFGKGLTEVMDIIAECL